MLQADDAKEVNAYGCTMSKDLNIGLQTEGIEEEEEEEAEEDGQEEDEEEVNVHGGTMSAQSGSGPCLVREELAGVLPALPRRAIHVGRMVRVVGAKRPLRPIANPPHLHREPSERRPATSYVIRRC